MLIALAEQAGAVAPQIRSLEKAIVNLQSAIDNGAIVTRVDLTRAITFDGLSDVLTAADTATLLGAAIQIYQAKLNVLNAALAAM